MVNHSDYKHVLDFYKIPSANLTAAALKTLAEHLLDTELCRCFQGKAPATATRKKKLKKSLKRLPKRATRSK
jgi:hypothetical protein